MRDWRKIEAAIEDFFRREKAAAARAGGDLELGVVHVDVEQRTDPATGGLVTYLTVDSDAVPRFVSMTRLAKELADLK